LPYDGSVIWRVLRRVHRGLPPACRHAFLLQALTYIVPGAAFPAFDSQRSLSILKFFLVNLIFKENQKKQIKTDRKAKMKNQKRTKNWIQYSKSLKNGLRQDRVRLISVAP
jgi:hypothetical protein